MSNQKKVKIINVKRSGEGIKFEQYIFESLWVKREVKLKEQGWILEEDIEEIVVEKVDDGKGINSVEVVEQKSSEGATLVDSKDSKAYTDMNLTELRDACDKKDIKYHHASKERKLISLLEEAK